MTHAELVARAARWLKNSLGCSQSFSEMSTFAMERPDVIGWKYGKSIIVECKATRSDFISDAGKLWRKEPEKGMGHTRYYFTPPGLIRADELPERWGLAECSRGVRIIRNADPFEEYQRDNEILFLCSMLRRIQLRFGGDLCEYIRENPHPTFGNPEPYSAEKLAAFSETV